MIWLEGTIIVASAAAGTVFGSIWYHPRVFGRAWMRMSNITPEMAERSRLRTHWTALTAFTLQAAVAYVFVTLSAELGWAHLEDMIRLAVYAWIAGVLPVLAGSVLWEHRPFGLYAINASYWLITFILMSAVITFFR